MVEGVRWTRCGEISQCLGSLTSWSRRGEGFGTHRKDESMPCQAQERKGVYASREMRCA